MVSWCKKGEYNAQISPNFELCGFNWANTHNKYVYVAGKFATKPTSYVAALHLVPNQIRSRINMVPTPAVAWTRA